MIKNITAIWLFVFTLFFLAPTQGLGMTEEQIFEWVSIELKIEKQYDMPIIQYINKEKLVNIFKNEFKSSYDRLVKKYGKERADEAMVYYSKEVIAMFIPKTCNLYVGNFIEPCKRQSIVAHELTHYYQHMKDGTVDPNSKDAANKHLYREMQAGNIERKYMEVFCGKEGGK